MTANGVVSVSLDPPLALACIGHDRNTHSLIAKSQRFGISILASRQESVAKHFTLPLERRPADHGIQFAQLGAVHVIASAVAVMECAVVTQHVAGDHTLFVAEVKAASVSDQEPLLWFRSKFGRFTPSIGPGPD